MRAHAASVLKIDKKRFARWRLAELSHFLIDDGAEGAAAPINRNLHALLFKVYQAHLDGEYITKLQAYRYIPLKHSVSCSKYLDEARAQGYLDFRRDKADSRVSRVVPGPQLERYIESEMALLLDGFSSILDKRPSRSTPKLVLTPALKRGGSRLKARKFRTQGARRAALRKGAKS